MQTKKHRAVRFFHSPVITIQVSIARVHAEGRTEAAVSGSTRASVRINMEPRLVDTNLKLNHADRSPVDCGKR